MPPWARVARLVAREPTQWFAVCAEALAWRDASYREPTEPSIGGSADRKHNASGTKQQAAARTTPYRLCVQKRPHPRHGRSLPRRRCSGMRLKPRLCSAVCAVMSCRRPLMVVGWSEIVREPTCVNANLFFSATFSVSPVCSAQFGEMSRHRRLGTHKRQSVLGLWCMLDFRTALLSSCD